MSALARALAAALDRALGTAPPARLHRDCPACHETLDYNSREVGATGDRQVVRCVWCGTVGAWQWDGPVPYLLGIVETRARVLA